MRESQVVNKRKKNNRLKLNVPYKKNMLAD